MENKILTTPIPLKAVPLFFALGGLFCSIIFNEFKIVFVLNVIIFVPLFYLTLVKYIFENNKIIITYPLLYKREYNIEDIHGYTFLFSGADTEFILFLNNGKQIKLTIAGKRMSTYIEIFINKINEKIKNKNIEELINNGLEFNFGKNKKIIFTVNYIEVIKKGAINRYYYKSDMEKILFHEYRGTVFTQIFTTDKNIIKFNDYMIKGKKGLIEYLKNNCSTYTNDK